MFDIDTAIELFENYERLKRDYHRVVVDTKPFPENYVFDENQSVRWNREKVKENNLIREDLKSKKLTLANNAYTEYVDYVNKSIKDELKCSNEAVKEILTYIAERCYDTPRESIEHIEELVGLIKLVLESIKD